MIEWAHPALIVLAAAAMVPLLPSRAGKALSVAAPLAAMAVCLTAPHGSWAEFWFFGRQISPWRADALSTIFCSVFSLMGALGAVYSLHEDGAFQRSTGLAYLGGALGITLAGDLLTLFVFWELSALAASALVFAGGRPGSGAAGMRYLLTHIFGGVLLLCGILMRTAQTGSLEFSSMSADISSPASWLILGGFLLNAAVPPLGAWLPDAYPRASVTGAVLMTAYTTKSAVYALMRGFPGTEALIWLGAFMAVYGVVYAVLENDARRLLAYHIISQVGYMVCGVGIGTQLALNGAAAHASAHIIYKALLFMGAGAVMQTTGKSRLSDMGGLWRGMPLTMGLYMIGAMSISAFPLFSGFVSKSMVVSAAGESMLPGAYLLLTLASAGTFLHTGLKLPYYMFFWRDSGVTGHEPPRNMLAAMALAALVCVLIGLFPGALYARLPFHCDYAPYTASHVTAAVGMLSFTALGFFMFLRHLDPEPSMSLDTDWAYRSGAGAFMRFLHGPLGRFTDLVRRTVLDTVPSRLSMASENPRAFLRIAALEVRLYFSTPAAEPVLRQRLDEALQAYPGETYAYRPVGSTVMWVMLFLVGYLALYYIAN